MKICFPVQHNAGLESTVYNHFGSAPHFVIVDTETNTVAAINNRDQHHAHGACNPLKALDNQQIDAVIVGGIGAGALTRLNQAGVKVYRAQSQALKDNIALLEANNLPEFILQGCCGGHDSGGSCSH